jgi:hypothetical protein
VYALIRCLRVSVAEPLSFRAEENDTVVGRNSLAPFIW